MIAPTEVVVSRRFPVVTVNNVELSVLEYRGQRVITFAQVDAAHGRPPGTAKRNFAEHRGRFVEGSDFFEVTADEIRTESLGAAFAPRTPRAILLTETGYTMLVKPFNDDLAWQVQRQIVSGYFAAARLLGEQPMPKLAGYVGDGCTLIESMTRTLRLAPSASLGLYQRLSENAGIRDLVPAYAIDAPGSGSGSSEPTLALRDLLARFQVGIGPARAYSVMEEAGLVQHLSRPSTTKGVKRYWSLTEAGEAFGKNMTNPHNQRETQPHFYVAEFPKLLEAIGLQGLLGAA